MAIIAVSFWTIVEICTLISLLLGAIAVGYFVFLSPAPSVGKIRKLAKRYLKRYPKTKKAELRAALREHLISTPPSTIEEDNFILLFGLLLALLAKLALALTAGIRNFKYERQSRQIENRIQQVLEEIYDEE